MISPQMSAWVRVWAWVSGGQGGGCLLLFGRPTGARSRLRGPRPPGGRRAAGGRRGLRACCGSRHDTGRGVRLGTAASLSKKNIPPTPPKPQAQETTTKKGFAGRRCRGRGAAGSAVPRRVPAARGAAGRRGPAGPPGPRSAPGLGSEESLPGSLRPPCSAAGCGPVAAVRSGAKRSAFWRSVVSCY